MAIDTTTQQIVDVVTPSAGESVTEGTILEWHAKVGDEIRVDDTIVEISTDKVDVELPAPATGTISEILVEEGDTVTVGQVIARIAVGGAAPVEPDAPASPAGEPNGAPAAPATDGNGNGSAAAPAQEERQPRRRRGRRRIVDVVTPAAGESVSEGTLLEWHVKVGDQIKADATIVEISTDKVDIELPSPATGTVTELLVAEGDTVTVGQVIARDRRRRRAQSAPAGSRGPLGARRAATASEVARGHARSHRSPHARRPPRESTLRPSRAAARRAGSRSPTSSRRQRATAHPGERRAATAVEASSKPMRGSAAALARYMDESRSIPTATSFRTLTVTTLDGRRRSSRTGPRKVSFTHLIAYAIARSAQQMDVMANHFAEVDGKPNRVIDGQVNLGLAVDVEKKDGSPHADGARDPRRRDARLRRLPRRLRRARGEGADEHADGGRPRRRRTSP